MLLWSVGSFVSLLKACSHFSEENIETILVSQVIQNYVGLNSSLRIRRSKSLAFVGHPTISVILTLGSCDMRRQIMVIPLTFCHSDTVVSDGTQRQIMVILHLLSSKGGGPDDMQRQIMIIPLTFCHLEAASPMTHGDKLWSFHSHFHHSDTVVSDGTQRQIMVILRPFVIQRLRARWHAETNYGHSAPLLSSRGGGPDDTRRQIMVIPLTFSPFRHSRVRWHPETNYGHSASFCHPEAAGPMTRGDKLWLSARFCYM